MPKKSSPQPTDASSEPSIKRLTSVAQMRDVFCQPIVVQIVFDKQTYEIEARRLTPAETATLDEMNNSIIPPIVKGKTMEEDRPDYTNTEYLKKKTTCAIETRALAIYWCVPAIKADYDKLNPGSPLSISTLTSFIQSQFTDSVLSVIHQAVTSGGVEVAKTVNFY